MTRRLHRMRDLPGRAFGLFRRVGGAFAAGLRPRRGRRFFGRSLEIPASLTILSFVLSFAAAFAIYHEAQRAMQERLARAYMDARFVTGFCDDHVAFDREKCEKYSEEEGGMGWQQIHSLLTEAKVIDPAEIETPTDLENLYDDDKDPLHDLLRELRPPDVHDGENAGSEKSLAFIYRLAQEQCLPESTTEVRASATPANGGRDDDVAAATKRAERIQGNLAYALADTFGGYSPGDAIAAFGDVLSGGDGETGGRCDRAREQLGGIGGAQPPAVSGLRFSTARCLSDAAILSKLAGLHRTIVLAGDVGDVGDVGDDPEPGYRLGKPCPGSDDEPEAFLRMESFTKTIQYALGMTHATREVRAAQKWANMARGPEHVGILALGLFALALLAVRHCALRARLARYRAREEAEGGALAGVVENLAAGGHRAERQLDALARGRTLVRWSIATVPALGFIGTVRGILEALAKAGDVVWAADRLERADAIGQLAGELGLAFSTTFFALALGILLGLVSALSRSHEERRIDGLVEDAAKEEET